MDKKIFFQVENRVDSDRSEPIFPMKPLEFEISISIKSYDEKATENNKIKKKVHSFQTIKDINSKI